MDVFLETTWELIFVNINPCNYDEEKLSINDFYFHLIFLIKEAGAQAVNGVIVSDTGNLTVAKKHKA